MTFQTIKESLLAHKLRSVIVLIVAGLVIFGIVKIANPKTTTASYTLGTVETGTIVSTVTGTGQVSSSNQIAVTAKSSGAITSLKVLPGQAVKKYQTIAVLDNKTARLNLDKARNDLKNAELDYANTKATQELSMQHQVISLNSSVSALPDIKNQDSVTPTISGSYNSTEQGRYTLKSYSCQTNSGICVDVSGIETDSVLVATNIPSSLGKRGLYITFSTLPKTNDVWTIDVPSPITNGYLSGSQNLTETSQQNAITLTAKQQSIENAKINLASAQSAYDDTIVTSPIDGQVGQLSVTEGQTINSGATVATLVTDKLFADIPLNEVDVAKVHQGDKVTATFDAISDLTLTGRVLSIDLVGTVTQGVVNYNVKIVFDTEDARVKSGMSISVAIATAVHQDVLIVPSSAVKTSGGASYVLSATSATDPAPTQIPVTVGLSDDMNTEILSGLKEGDSVVTKTTTTSNKSSTTTAPSILSSVGGNARGATRAIGR